MRKHLHGNGAAKTPTIEEDLEMVTVGCCPLLLSTLAWLDFGTYHSIRPPQIRAAGFEIGEHFDFMEKGKEMYGEDEFPWWQDLQVNWRFHLLPAHPWVRKPLDYVLYALCSIRLVPWDVYKASSLMNMGGDGLSGLGKVGAITPQYYVLGLKPAKA